MSFLSTVGKDFKAVFAWLGSSKGQATITAVEGLGESAATILGDGVVVQAAINVVNSWLNKIITTETVAAAASQQTGTGAQKAAAVLAAIGPELSQYFPGTTAAEAQTINTALVTVLNTLGAVATVAPAKAA